MTTDTPATFQIEFDTEWNTWEILDANGEYIDGGFDTERQAQAEANRLTIEANIEAREARMDATRSEIESALADCDDEAVLVRVLMMLELAKKK